LSSPFTGDLTAFHALTTVQGDGFVKNINRVRVAEDMGEDHSLVGCLLLWLL